MRPPDACVVTVDSSAKPVRLVDTPSAVLPYTRVSFGGYAASAARPVGPSPGAKTPSLLASYDPYTSGLAHASIGSPAKPATRFLAANFMVFNRVGNACAADVRGYHQVIQGQQRIIGRYRFPVMFTSSAAPPIDRTSSAWYSATGSTTGPRDTLIRIPDGFIIASWSALMRWWVSGVNGTHITTKSASANRVGKST